jgi:type I restriction enzyme R subunit
MAKGHGGEFKLVEWPCIEFLKTLGYSYVTPEQNEAKRERKNEVLFKDEVVKAIERINDVPTEVALSAYSDLLREQDNEQWLALLRRNVSKYVPGQSDSKTIRFIDFLNPANNTFQVTNQLYVDAQKSRIADLVIYVNGIPLVVIEAKSPLAAKDKSGEAFEQIKQYERDIPKLFCSNLFNLITQGTNVLYGATGAPSKFWGTWLDPWPKKTTDFATPFEQGLHSLLEPQRLLDLLSHFVVFERRDNKVIKKVCRYQQFRAVNKMVNRVVEGKERKGLVWHTQGSGKSLTMVFAALKLKYHHTIEHENLTNPNILVLTDRRDLDDQISKTFVACGLPNPVAVRDRQKGEASSAREKLQKLLHSNAVGQVALSTIFLFEGSRKAASNSDKWIVLVDECHRTQEKDLGAYLRATLPNARFFGFTGTPVKSTDYDTYKNFGAPGEGYLDKYGIDDAVRDGATVPIRYTCRKAELHVDPQKIDILFDTWFADEAPETVAAIKRKGPAFAELVKHPRRIELIATDIWAHFQSYLLPDGFKAQIVAIDREAVVLYKRALDKELTKYFLTKGLSQKEAEEKASAASVPIYSTNQEDGKPSEDEWKDNIRADLQKYSMDSEQERAIVGDNGSFQKRAEMPYFLIVCNKLLTGFDAPIESAMYLDNPLKEHSLLQAIARTNRVESEKKEFGLIVDYIGITKKLDEALETYRKEDVAQAMLGLEVEESKLAEAHAAVLPYLNRVKRKKQNDTTLQTELYELKKQLGTEDEWFKFRMVALPFVKAYESISPDPCVLNYAADFKWVVAALKLLSLHFDKQDSIQLKDFSAKVRDMLHQQLEVAGINTICKMRKITDPDFWHDFQLKPEEVEERDLKTAAARKAAEMKVELQEKMEENPVQYGPFSERVMALIRKYDEGLSTAAEVLSGFEKIVRDMQEEEKAVQESGISALAFGISRILEQEVGKNSDAQQQKSDNPEPPSTAVSPEAIRELASKCAEVYEVAHAWESKEQLKREMRQKVRLLIHSSGLASGEKLTKLPTLIEDFALRSLRH